MLTNMLFSRKKNHFNRSDRRENTILEYRLALLILYVNNDLKDCFSNLDYRTIRNNVSFYLNRVVLNLKDDTKTQKNNRSVKAT